MRAKEEGEERNAARLLASGVFDGQGSSVARPEAFLDPADAAAAVAETSPPARSIGRKLARLAAQPQRSQLLPGVVHFSRLRPCSFYVPCSIHVVHFTLSHSCRHSCRACHSHGSHTNLERGHYPQARSAGIRCHWSAVRFVQDLQLRPSPGKLLPPPQLKKFGPKGSWAVVTGASDGLGLEYASQLAAKGFNIVLVSRTASKLDALASTLQSKYSISTKTLAMDFSLNKDTDYAALANLVQGLDVSILINNVGQSHSIPVSFVETPEKELRDIITINCVGTLRVTQIVAPGMVQRKRGLILTMASFGGIIPTPLLATYSGSKAFLQRWSTAIGSELAPHGVQVQLVQSYLVTSAMSKIRKTSATIPNPRTFVKAALGKLGRSGGAQGIAYTSTPYWSHAVMHWGLLSFIGTTGGLLVGQIKVMHEAIRKRALRKAERDAKKQ
ncbi:hypothetical protein FH972_023742 [Carpinus fangiana]|uniref:Very-long-chain 3-oxoacyl-CoA reductase n=1 Tax=Carpinus fangiana TaxID=176857 RepID=A0A5N6KWB8_9ROSI|nr:hypothetical protein FH972_023742 [Carpinus fangiana]